MIRLELGDCRDVMAAMTARGDQVDCIVCDPPYELGFMGRAWDATGIAADPAVWRLALDVLRPGGMLLAFGGSRTQHRMTCAIEDAGFEIRDCLMWLYGSGFPKSRALLKPAYEPIVMARKPGPLRMLDIDGCRVPVDDPAYARNCSGDRGHADNRSRDMAFKMGCGSASQLGRFPANVLHDGSDEVLDLFAAHGERKSSGGGMRNGDKFGGGFAPPGLQQIGFGDSGTPARFFYCAKASKVERDGSTHPTIKPQALMRWLVRLVCPVGGVVFDPFAGSGSTLIAAQTEGFDAIGVERDPDNYADALRRCGLDVPEIVEAAE